MVSTDEERISTLSIKPRFVTRLWSLFRGTRYRIVIAHSGSIDKIVLYLNDDQIYSIVSRSTPSD